MHEVELIKPEPQHLAELGRICWEAFHAISCRHGFEDDFPDADATARALALIQSLPGSFSVAAKSNGRLVGSNFLLLTDTVAGLGPITVEPAYHAQSIGRQLMLAAIDYARQRGFTRMRLLQDSYNMASLSLYASLGFDVREPVAVMSSAALGLLDPTVCLAKESDVSALDALCVRFYKVSRRNELAAWMRLGFPVLMREVAGEIRGYLVPGKLGHGVAETEADALALITQIARYALPGGKEFMCPLRNTSLYRATLGCGCRISKVMILMTLGPYEEPDPVWMPSIAY